MSNFLEIAPAMAQRGVAVTPTYAGLRFPAKPKWDGDPTTDYYAATTDLKQIAAWANEDPNFNCCCISKFEGKYFLDIDDLARARERGMPDLPNTFTVETPGGGLHVYLTHTALSRCLGNCNVYEREEEREEDPETGKKKPRKKIVEVKGNNAAVCAPGCVRDDGGVYKIRPGTENLLFAEMPFELYEWLVREGEVKKNKSTAGGERKYHPDFDRDDLHEHFDWSFAVDEPYVQSDGAEYLTFETCPVCEHDLDQDDVKGRKCCLIYGQYGVSFNCVWCGESTRWEELMEAMEEKGYERYAYPIFVDEDMALLMANPAFPLADDGDLPVNDAVAKTVVGTPTEDSEDKPKTRADVRCDIDLMMRTDPKEVNAREKQRFVCEMIYNHMKSNGRFYNCGNVATYVDAETREIIQITKGSAHFERLLMRYGVFPADKLTMAIGMFLGGMATTAKENTVFLISHYDRTKHLLYINEYAGNYLRIDGLGNVTRQRNGDEDVLFTDGKESQCDPLRADLSSLATAPLLGAAGPEDMLRMVHTKGFNPGESSLITQEILNTIMYPEDGVGEENSKIILMTAILALFFQERIPSTPFVYLYGIGASMKSSLAQKVGRLLQGRRFKVCGATDDEQELKNMAMSMPFLVLDEANNVKRLTNILKVVATGGMDVRRELYTTSQMRQTPYQARIWMTANTASLTNETISARMMIIDAAQRTEAEPYRSEHYLEWPSELRNEIWTELVGRLRTVMVELATADKAGEGDLAVSHRMSSFFVFGRVLARVEGWEEKFMQAMLAMEQRQMGASAEDSEIAHLICALPASYNCELKDGKTVGMRSAEEWANILGEVVPEANTELQRKVARSGWIRYMFQANAKVLAAQCGLVTGSALTKSKNRIKVYGFTKCAGAEPKILVDDATVL